MSEIFVNGPVQNGNFDFDTSPHKLVSFRLSSHLNALSNGYVAPHLWNVVRLAGDVEYDRGQTPVSREDYERDKITDRYKKSNEEGFGSSNASSYMTDVDEDVVDSALQIIDRGLSAGVLAIDQQPVPVCFGCGNMTGAASVCGACGGDSIKSQTRKLLMSVRDGSSETICPDDVYARPKVKYISDVGNHVPNPLIVSRTRSLGVPLDDFGLSGSVLDPRAGLHVTALVAAERAQADTAIMLTTARVAMKIAVYGQHFRGIDGVNLQYGLHERIPYAELTPDDSLPDEEVEAQFRNWFLPIQSLVSREPIAREQIPALRKFYGRIAVREFSEEQTQEALEAVSKQICNGSLRWITDKNLLAQVRPAGSSSLS